MPVFGADPLPGQPELLAAAAAAGEHVATAIGLSRDWGERLPHPATGNTAQRWSALAAVARVNLTAARVLEAHTDALAILAEAGESVATGTTWGVFAAEGPSVRLDATPGDGRVHISGTKPWCSLAGDLDAALVTAYQDGRRRLFRIDDLRHESIRCDAPQSWVARGLRTVTSASVHFDATPAMPVGAPEWYLHRSGFAWGGIGVAACWHGGALGLADTLRRMAPRRESELTALHVGAVDLALHTSHAVLTEAAGHVDRTDAEPALLALRARSVVADSAERVLHHVGHALGPGPLAFDAEHAARVADLTLYLRQHHGERDIAALGAQLLAGGDG